MPDRPVHDRLVSVVPDAPALADEEREFEEALERALTEHADVWQALADLDAGK